MKNGEENYKALTRFADLVSAKLSCCKYRFGTNGMVSNAVGEDVMNLVFHNEDYTSGYRLIITNPESIRVEEIELEC